ncbi:mediator of RNA polymerase II transcription complex subunit 8-domain-containing protein [Xylaria intraflava]|nr:mediator of RNA polymerase II transcription complex subunit 8-domain-containing protein [Xylaria intraflava]
MASLGLTHEELKAIEQTRQRLSQLSSSLNSLKNDAFISNPLPNLSSLQASADILNHNVQAILDVLAQNNDLFARVAVHPSTNFPGRTQEGILLQLLRKKPEPDVEAAMDSGREMLAGLAGGGTALEAVWDTTRQACQARIADYVVHEEGDGFTAEERERGVENVRTGLLRGFDDEEDEESDSEESDGGGGGADADVMIVDRPPPPPAPAVSTLEVEGAAVETVMRVAVLGQLTR